MEKRQEDQLMMRIGSRLESLLISLRPKRPRFK